MIVSRARRRLTLAKAASILTPPLVAMTVALILFHTDYLASYENRLYDLHHMVRGVEPDLTGDVVIVAIDDASLQKEGVWPWPRERLARLIERIKQGEPKAVGLDLLVDLPENSGVSTAGRGDAAFASAVSESGPPTILPLVMGRRGPSGERPILLRPLPRFLSEHARPAAVNLEPDHTDARVRRFEPDPGDGQLSFPIALIAAAEGIENDRIGMHNDEMVVGERRIPTSGGNMLINYKGGRIDAFSAADVLDEFFEPTLFFRDRIVLVGRNDHACKDFMNTPVPGESLFQTELMAGVEIWKEALDTILQGRVIRNAPFLPVIAGVFLAAVVLSGLMLAAPRLSSLYLLLFLATWLLIVHTAFRVGLVRIPVMPGLMTFYFTSILSFVRLFMAQKRMKQLVTAAFESYVSPHVLSLILDNKLKLAVGGERKVLTILFADITGFTAYSELQPAEDVVTYLRGYFAEMNHVILDHDGIIDKLMGDGILAFFGDVDESGNHTLKAVHAAIEMQKRMARLAVPDGPSLRIRIGIHTGPVVVGNVGSDRHFEYTVIGRNVNLAQRLEGAAEPGGILVSESTWDALNDACDGSAPIKIAVKGFSEDILARKILGLKSPDVRAN